MKSFIQVDTCIKCLFSKKISTVQGGSEWVYTKEGNGEETVLGKSSMRKKRR